MKILVTQNAQIAGSAWKKGTILEAPDVAARAAVAEGVATDGAALEKALKAAAPKPIAKKSAAALDSTPDSTADPMPTDD